MRLCVNTGLLIITFSVMTELLPIFSTLFETVKMILVSTVSSCHVIVRTESLNIRTE